jgi:4-diphosphocytidyl-2-C-methyl-D-erythritol kinase
LRRLSVPSFAKINWILKILGKRSDGYQQLRTIYQTVDLSEEVVFETTSTREIQLEVEGRKVAPGEDNLLYQTADLLRKTAGSQAGVRIKLEKKIPVGAGLGGGSSNAALALLALNQLWDCKMGEKELVDLAAQLGSDVPFFLVGGTAVGLGRGTEVVPLPDLPREKSLLLLYPHLEISTVEAYSLGEWGTYGETEILTREWVENTMQDLLRAVGPKGDGWSFLENDFEDILFAHYPVLVEAREALKKAGCERVMLCGSGSTLLGFGSDKQVKEAAVVITREGIGETFLCRTLSREQYRQILTNSGLLLL